MEWDCLVSDVDGILTDGGHYYDSSGKLFKKFGSNDKDALKLINSKFVKKIIFVTADKNGYEITKKRIVEELGYELKLLDVKEERVNFFKDLVGKKIYLGDGIYDSELFEFVDFSICLRDSTPQARKKANYLLEASAGKNVFPALLELLESKKRKTQNNVLPPEFENDSILDLKKLEKSFSVLDNQKEEISLFCEIIKNAYSGKNKIIFCGVGKNATLSEMICEFLHPYNVVSLTLDPHRAVHGNLGILNKEDILILSTKSGNTAELVYLLDCLKRKGDLENKFLIVSNKNSELENKFTFKKILYIPPQEEIAQFSHSPQTTIFLYTAILMILVNRIAEKQKLTETDYLLNHQAGEIGKALGK